MPKTTRDREHLTDDEAAAFGRGVCPDCGTYLMQGPSGGGSQNFYCAGQECGSGFNEMGPFGIDRITDASPRKRVRSMPDPMERFNRAREDFSEQVRRTSNEELLNSMKYGQLAMSNWKADIIMRELRMRDREGLIKLPSTRDPQPAPEPKSRTAWARILNDEE